MRSVRGYGQRSRTARAATGCGIRVLVDRQPPLTPANPRRPPRRQYPGRDDTTCAHSRQGRTITHNPLQTRIQLYFFQFTIFADFYYFSHFDILFFSWCAPQSGPHLLCLTRFDLSITRSRDRWFLILFLIHTSQHTISELVLNE